MRGCCQGGQVPGKGVCVCVGSEVAPSWFLSKEGDMPMPASIEEMWETTAERRAEKLENTHAVAYPTQVIMNCLCFWDCSWGGKPAVEHG